MTSVFSPPALAPFVLPALDAAWLRLVRAESAVNTTWTASASLRLDRRLIEYENRLGAVTTSSVTS